MTADQGGWVHRKSLALAHRYLNAADACQAIVRTTLVGLLCGPLAGLAAVNQVFNGVGTAQTTYSYIVPPGITRISVFVGGAKGDTGDFTSSNPGGAPFAAGLGRMIFAQIAVNPGDVISGVLAGDEPRAACGAGGNGGSDGFADGGKAGPCVNTAQGGGGGGSTTLAVNGVVYIQAAGGGGNQGGTAAGTALAGLFAFASVTAANCNVVSNGTQGGAAVDSTGATGGGGGGGYIGGAGGAGRSLASGGSAAQGGTSCTRSTPGSFIIAPEIDYANQLEQGTVQIAWGNLTKAFSPNVISSGGITTLTFTITNPFVGVASVKFTDTLPSGLRIAATPNVQTNCLSAAMSAPAGGTTISVTDARLRGGGAGVGNGSVCTISVDVTNAAGQLNASCASNPAAFTNTSANISGLAGVDNAVTPSCVIVSGQTTLQVVKSWASGSSGADTVNIPATRLLGFISITPAFNASGGVSANSGAPVALGSSGPAQAGNTITFGPETFTPAARAASYTTVLSCLANGSPAASVLSGTNGQGSNTLTLAAGDLNKSLVCTYTNTPSPPVTLRLDKTWAPNAIAGNAVTAITTGGSANATVSSTATSAGNSTAGTAVNVNVGNTITLPAETFNTGSAANYTSTVTCNNSTAPLTNASLPASFTVAAADTAVVCTYTNTIKAASFTLSKTWVTAQTNDAVNVTATGLTPLPSVANTASETDTGGVQSVTAGSAITLAETFTTGSAVNYTSALACTGNATPLSGNVLTVNGVDTAIVCTFTNTRRIANLSVVKTANPTSVQTGGTVVFTLTVNNGGPAAANGSILRDKPGAGLSCTAAPTCSASGGASCPSAAALTANAITSNAGVPIPVLPAGGQVVVTMSCTATASGS